MAVVLFRVEPDFARRRGKLQWVEIARRRRNEKSPKVFLDLCLVLGRLGRCDE